MADGDWTAYGEAQERIADALETERWRRTRNSTEPARRTPSDGADG